MATALTLACSSVAARTAANATQALTPARQRELLRGALNAFDEAVSVVRDDPARAENLYRKSAAALETLRDHGIQNPALEYNLGNAYFRLGQLGRAILHYRRAQRFDPADAALTMNLEYARNRVEPYIKPSGGRELVNRLMFWTNRTSIQERFWLASLGSIVGWLGLAFRLRWLSRPLTVVACLGIVFGLANAASVGWQLHDESRHPPAVVVDGEQILRLGRGEGYDPALTQPLGPGVELRILNQRGDWVEIRLRDDKTGWLPAGALERI
ncbi:MAG: tetratricopeptide repeat protein [Phycisphaerae bacterium]